MSASPKEPSPSLVEDETDENPRSGSSSPSEAETNPGTSVEPAPPATSTPSSGSWQAIWSPAHSAYYFYNPSTQETTWVNPLQPPGAASGDGDATSTTAPSSSVPAPASGSGSGSTPSTSTGGGSDNPNAPQQLDPSSSSAQSSSSGATPVPASIAQIYALQEAAAAQGIDPSLAYLDPSLAGGPSAPGGSGVYNFTAKFNAHTGAFARPDGRDPTHLSEYERMKRMSSVYFNMEQWEQEVAQRKNREDEDAANGKKRKRPTKKDLVGPSMLSVLAGNAYCDFVAGALQRAKEVEKDRKDSLAAHVDSGCAPQSFFFLWAVYIGAFSHTSFVAIFLSNPSFPKIVQC